MLNSVDYSWLEVIKKSLDSLDRLASRLRAASPGETRNDSELRMIIAELEENASNVSRLLSFDNTRKVFSKYHITPHELYVLAASIDDDTQKSLLRGNTATLNLIADRLSIFLFRRS